MSSIADKFRQLGVINNKEGNHQRKTVMKFPDIRSYKADGKDHINIGNGAKTELGLILSNSYVHPFQHPVLGSFKTIEGYWFYLKSGDDRCRNENVKDISRTVDTNYNLKGFRFLVLEGVYYKLKSMRQRLIELLDKYKGLPLDIYYESKVKGSQKSLRTRVQYFEWFLPGVNEAISAIVENREPDFSSYMNGLTADKIYQQFLVSDEEETTNDEESTDKEDVTTDDITETNNTETQEVCVSNDTVTVDSITA